MHATRDDPTPILPRLNLWDAVSLIVGIIVGVGIFQTPSDVAGLAPGVVACLAMWVVGGLLALVGALCFAELSSTYPRAGGEYAYLTRAFGPWFGFVFAWTQLIIIRPASIGAVAYIFAIHSGTLTRSADHFLPLVALAAIGLLTGINILGVTLGKNVQNALTVLKILGLAGILFVGIGWGSLGNFEATGPRPSLTAGWFATAMIIVLWTYAGWHETAYIAPELKNNRRNLPLSLILGTVIVMAIYAAINLALVAGLGIDRLGVDRDRDTPTAISELVSLAWPDGGAQAMSVLIMVSALGALNGMIFTTARIGVAFGIDHSLFAPLTRWSPSFHTPVRALILEAVISMAFVLGVHAFSPTLALGAAGARQADPFADLIFVTAAIFWFLFLMTGVALFVLRRRDADVPRVFSVPGYPATPILFCLWCGYMVVGAVAYRPIHSLAGVGIALIGLPLYFLQRSKTLSTEPRVNRDSPTTTPRREGAARL